MNLTLVVKLLPTPQQHTALLETMAQFNAACNAIAEVAYRNRLANKYELQKLVYQNVRERFGLSAQMAIRAISKVVEAYKRDRSIQPSFRPHGAIVYDERILSWKGIDQVSILSLSGRLLIPVRFGQYQAQRLGRVHGQADLVYRNGVFYLYVVVDLPEAPLVEGDDVIGVDLGIINLATDSDGDQHSGEAVDTARRHYEHLQRSLQQVSTKSSHQRLKRLSGRERRFKHNTNHVISKRIVAKALDTGRDIALEELTGIRDRITVNKAQRTRHSKWAFGELRRFIVYKAQLAGVLVHFVDPRNTSRTCPNCDHTDKANRPDRSTFRCTACGFAGHADIIAARNIRARAVVNRLMVSDTLISVAPGTS
jgi:putative transposase